MDQDTITEPLDEQLEHDLDEPTEQDQHDVPPSSLLGRLRAQREEIADHSSTHELLVPGYEDPELVLVMAYRDFDQMRAIGRALSKVPKKLRDKYAAADTLVEGCVGVLMRDPETGTEHRLSDGFDRQLVEAMELEGGPKRAVVFQTFENEHGVIAAAMKYGRWLQHGGVEVDDAFMGE